MIKWILMRYVWLVSWFGWLSEIYILDSKMEIIRKCFFFPCNFSSYLSILYLMAALAIFLCIFQISSKSPNVMSFPPSVIKSTENFKEKIFLGLKTTKSLPIIFYHLFERMHHKEKNLFQNTNSDKSIGWSNV